MRIESQYIRIFLFSACVVLFIRLLYLPLYFVAILLGLCTCLSHWMSFGQAGSLINMIVGGGISITLATLIYKESDTFCRQKLIFVSCIVGILMLISLAFKVNVKLGYI